MLMEHSFPKGMKKLEIQSNYNNIHFVYIMDAIKAITEIVRYYLANGVFLHSEEHIRYDNNGTSIKNIVTLFEKVNQIEFKEKNIITLESTAPYHGAPSTFLNNFNTDKKF
jgi:cupin superfamily acireductone dioxygenase involved in methionine salvage